MTDQEYQLMKIDFLIRLQSLKEWFVKAEDVLRKAREEAKKCDSSSS